MDAKRFWLSPVLAALLCLGAVLPAHADSWQCATTEHFTLYASGEPDSVVLMARELERMADLLGREGMGSTSRVRARVFLIAFPNRRAFSPHQPMQDGKRVQVAGYAESTPYAHWIGYVADEQQGRWTANHEFVHTIAAELFQNVPTCLNEGMAEFYSTSYADRGGIHYGGPIPWHRETLKNGALLPLDDLFGSKARSLAYAGGQTTAMFYAESWVLVHYLASQLGSTPRFRRFASMVASGTPAREAMAQVYPAESWVSLPDQLKAYAAADEHFPDYELPMPGSLAEIAVALRAADSAEIAVHTGLWRMQPAGADAQVTRSLFDQARQNKKTAALAADGFGLLALQGSEPREAEKEFRAAASDPEADPLALTIAGAGLLQIAGQDTAGRRARVDEALAILEKSVARDSLDARALAWYGEGSVMGGRYTPRALRALEQASSSLPGDPQLARALALARHEGSLAAQGLPSGKAAVDSVNAQVQSGRYEAAIAILAQIESDATDPTEKQNYREDREHVEYLRDQNHAVDAYNRGVTALKSYQFVEAAREFDEAREGARDSTLREDAAARLDEIPSYEAFQHGLDAVKKNNFPGALTAFQHARALAKNDEFRHQCDKNIAQLQAVMAKKPAH